MGKPGYALSEKERKLNISDTTLENKYLPKVEKKVTNKYLQGEKAISDAEYQNKLKESRKLTSPLLPEVKPVETSKTVGKWGVAKLPESYGKKTVKVGKAGQTEVELDDNKYSRFVNAAMVGGLDGATLGVLKKPLDLEEVREEAPAGYMLGEIMGYAAPVGQINKVVGAPLKKAIAGKTASKLLPVLAEGAATGAVTDVASGMLQGDDAETIAKRTAAGAGIGAVLDLALHGAGRLVDNIAAKKALKEADKARETLKQTKLEQYKKPVKVGGEVTPPSVRNLDEYLNNLEYQDYINSLDPNYIRAENAARAKQGLPPLKDAQVKTSVVTKKERIPAPEVIEVPKVSILKERLTPEQVYLRDFANKNNVSIDDMIEETRQNMKTLEEKQIKYLKESGGRGVNKEVMTMYDDLGREQGKRAVMVSENPGWYSDFYSRNKRKPTQKDLEELAREHLENGFADLTGEVPVNEEYLNLKKQLSDLEMIKNSRGNFSSTTDFEGTLKVKNPEKPTFKNEVIKKDQEVILKPQRAVEPPKVEPKKVETPKIQTSLEEAAVTSPPKEPPKVEIPNKTTPPKLQVVKDTAENTNLKDRQFVENSMKNSEAVPGDFKEQLPESKYQPITNEDTLNKANSRVNSNPEKALNEYRNVNTTRGLTADDVALGESLIVKAIKEGDYKLANELTADLAARLTQAGQAVQAASIMKRMTPEGFLTYVQRQINDINKNIETGKFKGVKKIELTASETQKITDFMEKAQRATGREKDILIGQAAKVFKDKIPSTIGQKIKGFQILSMLTNPKSMVRNTLGNLIFTGVENISNSIGAGIDKGIGKLTGKRTTFLPSITGQIKSMGKGVKETIEDAKLGIDTSAGRTQFDIKEGQTFKGKLGKVEKVTGTALQLGDRPFYQAAYDESLRQQMKAAGVKEPTEEMIQKAHALAQYRTYQDINGITKLFQGTQRALNNVGTEDFGLGNIVLPFPKTPANILARSLDYSPAGLIKVVRAATKNGFDQKVFVDSLSRVVTGSGAILLGYGLAKNGVITGQADKDKDVANLERSMGKTPYSFNSGALKRMLGGKDTEAQTGDKYKTYDWAQPVSILLAIGADIYHSGKKETDAGAVAIDAFRSGGTTLFKQSLLQGLQRFLGGYSPIDSFAETAANTPAQFVPTLLKQVNQFIDPKVRGTSNDNLITQGLNLIGAKVPGISQTLPKRVDTFGNDIEQYQGKNNPYNVFLNPGNTSTYSATEVQKEIYNVYKETGDKGIFPRVATDSFKYQGKEYKLSQKEVSQFQEYIGKETAKRFESLINSKAYKDTWQTGRAKLLKDAIEDVYNEAKAKYARDGRF